jgi:hypothetical protein
MIKIGDLNVWWIPQVGMTGSFEVDVGSVAEGVKIMDVLARYDAFQFERDIKPDYCNVGGLRRWCEDGGEGAPGWEDWYDDETGEDDPIEWLASQPTLVAAVPA